MEGAGEGGVEMIFLDDWFFLYLVQTSIFPKKYSSKDQRIFLTLESGNYLKHMT